LNRVIFSLILALRWLGNHLPRPLLGALLRGLARLVYWLDAKHRRIADLNLDLAFGDELTPERKRAIVRACFEKFAWFGVDFARSLDITRAELLERLRFRNPEIMERAQASGRPVILITGHYSNWELLGKAMAAAYGPVTGVRRNVKDSPLLDQYLARTRQRFDIEMVPRKGAVRRLMRELERGERTLGLLTDQDVPNKHAVRVDFFGRPANHTPAICQLARRYNALMVPAFASTEDNWHYDVTFHEPLECPASNDAEADVRACAQAQADLLEQVIRAKPEEYFWFHKRWKSTHRKTYKEHGAL
jgi:KDO2-lipid IV(A) lauroyltransferase